MDESKGQNVPNSQKERPIYANMFSNEYRTIQKDDLIGSRNNRVDFHCFDKTCICTARDRARARGQGKGQDQGPGPRA